MAMAQDAGSPPDHPLNRAILEHIRGLLVTYTESSANDAEGLRDALRQLADDARAKGVPPEHLLTALKDLWRSLPQMQRRLTPGDEARLLQRVVSICIAEYYRG
jgi:hypothetical protein